MDVLLDALGYQARQPHQEDVSTSSTDALRGVTRGCPLLCRLVDDLVMARSAYFLAVRAVVNREDPAGLLSFGAPEDEYDPEVEDLIRWRQAVTPDEVTDVFRRWFGDQGVILAEMAARIAAGIKQARAQHLPK
jgi:hypothetical protein